MRRRTVLIALALAFFTVAAGLGTHYLIFVKEAREFDRLVAATSSEYSSIRARAQGPNARPTDIAELLKTAEATMNLITGRYADQSESLLTRKRLARKYTRLPATAGDLERLADTVDHDIRGLIELLTPAIRHVTVGYDTRIAGGTIVNIQGASSEVEELVNQVETARTVLAALQPLNITQDNNQALAAANRGLSAALTRATQTKEALKIVVARQRDARVQLKIGLDQADRANGMLGEMEQFASASTIQIVHNNWLRAKSHALSAVSILDGRADIPNQNDRLLASGLLEADRRNVEDVIARIDQHVAHVGARLDEAIAQESTLGGRAVRGLRRLGERFGNSRIGQESSIAVSGLILGTKILFDYLTMPPGMSPLTWASAYESDLSMLSERIRQVQRIDGPSLTGKNTLVEGIINGAYARSFSNGN